MQNTSIVSFKITEPLKICQNTSELSETILRLYREEKEFKKFLDIFLIDFNIKNPNGITILDIIDFQSGKNQDGEKAIIIKEFINEVLSNFNIIFPLHVDSFVGIEGSVNGVKRRLDLILGQDIDTLDILELVKVVKDFISNLKLNIDDILKEGSPKKEGDALLESEHAEEKPKIIDGKEIISGERQEAQASSISNKNNLDLCVKKMHVNALVYNMDKLSTTQKYNFYMSLYYELLKISKYHSITKFNNGRHISIQRVMQKFLGISSNNPFINLFKVRKKNIGNRIIKKTVIKVFTEKDETLMNLFVDNFGVDKEKLIKEVKILNEKNKIFGNLDEEERKKQLTLKATLINKLATFNIDSQRSFVLEIYCLFHGVILKIEDVDTQKVEEINDFFKKMIKSSRDDIKILFTYKKLGIKKWYIEKLAFKLTQYEKSRMYFGQKFSLEQDLIGDDNDLKKEEGTIDDSGLDKANQTVDVVNTDTDNDNNSCLDIQAIVNTDLSKGNTEGGAVLEKDNGIVSRQVFVKKINSLSKREQGLFLKGFYEKVKNIEKFSNDLGKGKIESGIKNLILPKKHLSNPDLKRRVYMNLFLVLGEKNKTQMLLAEVVDMIFKFLINNNLNHEDIFSEKDVDLGEPGIEPIKPQKPKKEIEPIRSEEPKKEIEPIRSEEPKPEIEPRTKQKPKTKIQPIKPQKPKTEIEPSIKEELKPDIETSIRGKPNKKSKKSNKEIFLDLILGVRGIERISTPDFGPEIQKSKIAKLKPEIQKKPKIAEPKPVYLGTQNITKPKIDNAITKDNILEINKVRIDDFFVALQVEINKRAKEKYPDIKNEEYVNYEILPNQFLYMFKIDDKERLIQVDFFTKYFKNRNTISISNRIKNILSVMLESELTDFLYKYISDQQMLAQQVQELKN